MSNIQITDLIDDAVENALIRREQNLTPEQAEQVEGGLAIVAFPPIILGMMFPPKLPPLL